MWVLFVAVIFTSGETALMQYSLIPSFKTEKECLVVKAQEEKVFLKESKDAGMEVEAFEFACVDESGKK